MKQSFEHRTGLGPGAPIESIKDRIKDRIGDPFGDPLEHDVAEPRRGRLDLSSEEPS
jgi:hypothetical protein